MREGEESKVENTMLTGFTHIFFVNDKFFVPVNLSVCYILGTVYLYASID